MGLERGGIRGRGEKRESELCHNLNIVICQHYIFIKVAELSEGRRLTVSKMLYINGFTVDSTSRLFYEIRTVCEISKFDSGPLWTSWLLEDSSNSQFVQCLHRYCVYCNCTLNTTQSRLLLSVFFNIVVMSNNQF